MKFRLLGAGAILAASVLAPQQAHALVATTTYQQFKLYQNPAFNTPTTLDFATFTSLAGPGFNLTGVGFKIAGNPDGTGSAMVGGNPRVSNLSETDDLQAFISYAPKWSIQSLITPPPIGVGGAMVGPVTGSTQNATPNPVNCVGSQTCPGLGGNTIPMSSNRTLNLQGSYNGSGGFASINGAWSGPNSGNGVRLTNGSANFTGGNSGDLAFTFDPTVGGSVASKPFIMGYIAVQYEYNDPSPVPGPLPLFGAAAAFGWSRRLRKRVSSAA
jgi:MYXO-CTERM domain-containing protein